MFEHFDTIQQLRLHFATHLLNQGEPTEDVIDQAKALTDFVLSGPELDDLDEDNDEHLLFMTDAKGFTRIIKLV